MYVISNKYCFGSHYTHYPVLPTYVPNYPPNQPNKQSINQAVKKLAT